MDRVKKVLTIAGSDSSGGAGIQADLKTIQAHDMFGMSVVTSVTAQNTTGVYGIYDVTPEFVGRQIDAVMTDIMPDAVKIGMVSNCDIIHIISEKMKEYRPKYIVADPVMVSTSGCMLLNEDAKEILMRELLPLANLITPNIPEAEVLSGRKIHSTQDMLAAAQELSSVFQAVLIKGGHFTDRADDLLYVDGQACWLEAKRLSNPNTHGTGCTLSSAIACELAAGKSLQQAVKDAKQYVYLAIAQNLNLGQGSGPLWHNVRLPFAETDV